MRRLVQSLRHMQGGNSLADIHAADLASRKSKSKTTASPQHCSGPIKTLAESMKDP